MFSIRSLKQKLTVAIALKNGVFWNAHPKAAKSSVNEKQKL
jgi:hypothetical protein